LASPPLIEKEYFTQLLSFFNIEYLFLLPIMSDVSYDRLLYIKKKIDNYLNPIKMRTFSNNHINYLVKYHNEHFGSDVQANKSDIELLAINNFLYLDNYTNQIKFDIYSAYTLVLINGLGLTFLDQYLSGKKEALINKLKMFATDNTIKNISNLTMIKCKKLGIKNYRWQTQEDNKVRPAHVLLDQKVMDWEHPDPLQGHPGSAPNCRCVALPLTL